MNLRKIIIDHLKNNSKITTKLGELTIDNKLLGEGGTAIVYSSICGKYAIKFLVEDISKPKQSQIYLRFRQEFNNLFELSKIEKRVAEIFDEGSIEILYQSNEKTYRSIIPFVVLKRYSGSLKKLKGNIDIQGVDVLDTFFWELLDLIDVIHTKNIIHRDIKPDNIFIDENDRLVLGDFGIAWFDKSIYEKLAKTEKSDRLANFDFSAPEQFKAGTKAAYTMDLFALGQMLQWYVTGNTVKGLGSPKLSYILDASFFYYDKIIERLVQANPSNRPQSINELREIWTQEKANSNRNWLLHNSSDYNKFVDIIEDWTGMHEIPRKSKAKSLLRNLYKELTSNEFLFLVSSIFRHGSQPSIVDYGWDTDLNSYVNFSGEDIFENFEVDFSRIDQEGLSFNFTVHKSTSFSICSDSFKLYPFNRREFKFPCYCIYSEITGIQSKEKYLLLVLNNTELSYRLKKL